MRRYAKNTTAWLEAEKRKGMSTRWCKSAMAAMKNSMIETYAESHIDRVDIKKHAGGMMRLLRLKRLRRRYIDAGGNKNQNTHGRSISRVVNVQQKLCH